MPASLWFLHTLIAAAVATSTCKSTLPTDASQLAATVCGPIVTTDPPPNSFTVTAQLPPANFTYGFVAGVVPGMTVSYSDRIAGLFTLTFDVGPVVLDDWPWRGLDIGLVFSTPPHAGGVAYVNTTLVVGSSWTEAAQERGLSLGSLFGVCVADVDNDGFNDVLTVGSAKAVLLYMNNGTGYFTDEASSRVADAVDSSTALTACAFGDVNNDGNVDAVVGTSTFRQGMLLINQGNGTFLDVAGDTPRGLDLGDSRNYGLAIGDLNGDGFADIFVPVHDDPNILLINRGYGFFVEGVLPSTGRKSQQVAMLDVDHDGDLDVLVANNGQANELLINSGRGTFADEAIDRGIAEDGETFGIAAGDLNGDGYVDIVLSGTRPSNVHNPRFPKLFLNTGGGFFTSSSVIPDDSDPPSKVFRGVVTLDAELDGDLDVFVGVSSGGDEDWLNIGDAQFLDASTALNVHTGNSTPSVAAIDIENDGDLDFVAVGATYFLRVNPNSRLGNWLFVRPRSPSGAASVYGAIVTVTCDVPLCDVAWSAVRFTQGASSFQSQSQYGAHFGVPASIAEVSVTVVWPGGGVSSHVSHPKLGNVTLPAAFDVYQHPPTMALEVAPFDTVSTVSTVPMRLVVTSGQQDGLHVVISMLGVTLFGVLELGGGVYEFGADLTGTLPQVVSVNVTAADSLEQAATVILSAVPVVTPSHNPSDVVPMASTAVCGAAIRSAPVVDALAFGSTHVVQLNDGDFNFAKVTTPNGIPPVFPEQASSCSVSDWNGDGLLDIALLFPSSLSMFIARENGTYGNFTDPAHALTDLAGNAVVLADIDGNLLMDIVVATSQNDMLLRQQDDGFESHQLGSGFDVTLDVAVFDANGDALLDVFFVKLDAADELYLQGASSSFTLSNAAISMNLAYNGPSVAAAAADFNADGLFDLVVATQNSTRVMVNVDGTVFALLDELDAALPADVVAVDYELDGDLDIVVLSPLGSNAWLNAGDASFRLEDAVFGGSGLPATSVIPADFDGDGDVDFVFNGFTVENLAFVPGGALASITVVALSAAQSPAAFGTSVHLHCVTGCGQPWQGAQVVSRSTGGSAAVFGLPFPAARYNISVVWSQTLTANWSTNPLLGLATSGVFVVRSDALCVTITSDTTLPVVLPADDWTGPIVANVSIAPDGIYGGDLRAVGGVVINGTAYLETSRNDDSGAVNVTYGDDPFWPWTGLNVSATFEDSTGLLSGVTSVAAPGSAMIPLEDVFDEHYSDMPCVCMGDLDSDGDVDVVVPSNDTLWVHYKDDDYGFDSQSFEQPSPGVVAVQCALVDWNADGATDIVVLGEDMEYYEAVVGSARFEASVLTANLSAPVMPSVKDLVFGDFNSDNLVDMFVCSSDTSQLLLSKGSPLAPRVSVPSPFDDCVVAVAMDLDGNLTLDLAVFVSNDSPQTVLNGWSTTGPPLDLPSVGFVQDVIAVDMTNDGMLDLYVTGEGSSAIYVKVNSGGVGGFILTELPGGSATAVAFDWEADGDVDVCMSGSPVQLRVDGSPYRLETTAYGLQEGRDAIVAGADVDRDGDVDVFSMVRNVLYINTNHRVGLRNWLVARPLTVRMTPLEYGTTVVVSCEVGCAGWSSARITANTPGGYDLHFGLPVVGGAAYNMTATWPSGVVTTWADLPQFGTIIPKELSSPMFEFSLGSLPPSPTPTANVSTSPSSTPSASPSPSSTGIFSTSPSSTPSASTSPSSTPSTPSSPGIFSVSPAPSATPTASASNTVPLSPLPSASPPLYVSPTSSASPTASGTLSPTTSLTSSQTSSGSRTPTPTSTGSRTPTPTSTGSSTPTPTPTSTTAPATPSPTPTPSATSSPSSSTSSTASITPTPSRHPLLLAGVPSNTIVTANPLPTIPLTTSLNCTDIGCVVDVCSAELGVEVSCSPTAVEVASPLPPDDEIVVSVALLAGPLSSSLLELSVTYSPLFVETFGGQHLHIVQAATPAGLPTSASVAVGLPQCPSAGEVVEIVCSVGDGAGVVEVVGRPTFTSSSCGETSTLTIAATGAPPDGFAYSTHFSVACAVASSGGIYDSELTSARGIEGTLTSVVTPVVEAMHLLDDGGEWEATVSADGVFAATLSKSRLARLVGRGLSPLTTVSVGGVPAPFNASVTDGIIVHMPAFASLFPTCDAAVLPEACGQAVATVNASDPSCSGYRGMALVNPDDPVRGLGGVRTCPQDCAGATQPSDGVFYTAVCSQGAPPGPACLDPATAGECQYGFGDACQPCPPGSLCPGGLRVWPLPGFWSRCEASPVVTECSFPADERCEGWTGDSVDCGVGYEPDSPLCASCAKSFYPDNGLCVKCDDDSGVLAAVGVFLASCAALFAVMVVILTLIMRRSGGTLAGGFFRARDFVVWTVLSWQTLAQVGKRSVGAPEALRWVYNKVTLFDLDPAAVVHEACLSDDPFVWHRALFAVVLGCVGALALLWVATFRARRHVSSPAWLGHVGTASRLLLSTLVLLYSPTSQRVFAVLRCEGDEVGTLRLASNPAVVCYEGKHVVAAGLAWVCLAVHVLGFPIAVTMFLLRRLPRGAPESSGWCKSITYDRTKQSRTFRAMWSTWLEGDFPARYFWLTSYNMVMLFVLSLSNAFSGHDSIELQGVLCTVTIVALLFGIFLVRRLHPYVPRKQWKAWPKCLVLGAGALGVLVNFLAVLELEEGVSSLATVHTVFAYCAFAACIILAVTFVVVFFMALTQGAAQEKRDTLTKPTSGMMFNPLHGGMPKPGVVVELPTMKDNPLARRRRSVRDNRRTSLRPQFQPQHSRLAASKTGDGVVEEGEL